MKVTIDTDERYPDHCFSESKWPWAVDVPDETIERWREAERQYQIAQEEMAAVSEQSDALWRKHRAAQK